MIATVRARAGRDRTHRLQELVLLAAAFNGWSLRQLADALERDPSKLIPDSGDPKLDLIMRLAGALGWNVDDLLRHLDAPSTAPGTQADDHDDAAPDALGGRPIADAGVSPTVHGESRQPVFHDETGRGDGQGGALTDSPLRARRPRRAGELARGELARGELAPEELAPGELAPGELAPGELAAALTEGGPHAPQRGRREADAVTSVAGVEPEEPATAAIESRVRRLRARAAEKLACGRHGDAVEAYRAALAALTDLDAQRDRLHRAELLLGLADAHHRLGEAIEGRAIATEALAAARWKSDEPSAIVSARALLLRATCARDLLERRPGRDLDSIEDALCDVAGAERLVSIEGVTVNGVSADGPAEVSMRPTTPPPPPPAPEAARVILHRATGLRLELESLREPARGPTALARILAELDGIVDVERVAESALLESHGWWCVAGFAIARRHLRGATLHRTLGILSNKVDEIASRVDSWPLRERVLTLEFERRERLADDGGSPGAWILDHEDVRTIVGCIGGSRRFRAIGLDILRTATLVDTPSLPAVVRRRIAPEDRDA